MPSGGDGDRRREFDRGAGWRSRATCRRSPAPAAGAAVRGTTLLAPFDSLLWYRDRGSRGFRLRLPDRGLHAGHKRVHGYYTLPILHEGHLIGRVDAKTHRAERRLEVRHVHFEPWFADGAPAPGTEAPLSLTDGLAGWGTRSARWRRSSARAPWRCDA
jgi:uncharacterized protein YcaQ